MNKEIMKKLGFGAELNNIEAGNCATCGEPVKAADFKNDLSRREYEIAGMCQLCQDKTFKS